MPYGTIKVDNITFTNGGSDQTVTVSGIVQSISGNITATGTIQGQTIIGTSTVSGATVTGNAGVFTTLTGGSAGFTSVTGATVTGTTANFVSGVFTAQISGATVTGNTAQFTTLTGGSAGFTTVTGTTVTGTTANFASGVFTAQISGATVTGNVGSFATITGGTVTLTSGVFGAGTASLPSISFSSDPNTGIYSPGADQVAISTGGSGRLFVDASGNINIGSSFAGFGNGSGVEIQRSTTATLRLTGNSGVGCEFYNTGSLASIQTRSAIPFTIQTNEQERLRITSAGLVGVGTSSPGGQLTVYSAGNQVRVESPAASNADILFRENGVTNWTAGYVPFISAFRFSNGSSDVLTLTNTGNVGVGTTSPNQPLEVNGVIRGGSYQFSTSSTTTAEYLGFSNSNGPTLEFWGSASANAGSFLIKTAGTERARIDSSGNVGIGTSSPTQKLDVADGDIVLRKTTGGDTSGVTSQVLRIGTQSGDLACFYAISAGAGGPGGRGGDLYIQTKANNGSPTDRLVITEAGNVGIGTSAPSSQLHCTGDIKFGDAITLSRNISTGLVTITDATAEPYTQGFAFRTNETDEAYRFQNGDGTSTYLTIRGSGAVGIGTTSPGAALEIVGGSANNVNTPAVFIQNDRFLTFKNTTGTWAGAASATSSNNLLIAALNNLTLATGANADERARIDSSGRLLVGTSADSGGALLQVNGDRIRVATAKTPASATATGTAGEICWDADYIYVCTATNTWKRTAISTW